LVIQRFRSSINFVKFVGGWVP